MKQKIFALVFVLIMIFSSTACSRDPNNSTTNVAATSATDTLLSDTSLSDTSKHYGTTFGQGDVIDIYIEVSEADWQDMKDNAKNEEYHTANITVNGTKVENVGFRTKGFSSLNSVASSDSDRYGFKIKTDEFIDGQTLNGLDIFVLNGSFSDPSYMREYLTYEASNYLGCATPYITYTNIYINGELFGFYLMIEAYDDSFVERNTGESGDTVLYKAVSEDCTLLSNDDGKGFDVQYGEDDDRANIETLISVLNSTTPDNKAELEKILDINSVLEALAVNTVMGNYDSYSGSKAHNYYLLYSNGKFSYIGWDYNMSVGGFSEDNGASVTVDVNSPVYNVDASQRPLIEKLLAIEAYKTQYLQYVDQLINYFSDFETTVADLSNLISDYVKNDPSAFYTFDKYESSLIASDADLSQIQNNMNSDNNRNNGNNRPSAPNGEAPSLPDGVTPSDGGLPAGNRPDSAGNGNPGGGMINQNAVSIVDYITQRIENIKEQL